MQKTQIETQALVTTTREIGLGPLEPLLRDQRISDVLVNGPADIWVEADGSLARSDTRFENAEAVVAAVRRAIAPLGLRLDRANPAVDARLPDGSRLHAMIPPASVDGPVVAIRRFTQAVRSLDDLVETGGIERSGKAALDDAVQSRANVLVSGATGSGKTTLLNILASRIDSGDRIVTIEARVRGDVDHACTAAIASQGVGRRRG